MLPLSTLAQRGPDYGHHMDSGWGWAMFVVLVLVTIAVVGIAAWVLANGRAPAPPGSAPAPGSALSPGPSSPTPLEVLDHRLAAGDITPEDYHERAAILGKPKPPPQPPAAPERADAE